MNEHCNILILSVTAGNGHNSAAAALKEEFDRQGVACFSIFRHWLQN